MVKLIRLYSVNTFCMGSLILLCGLFVPDNVFSRNKWDRTFANVYYDPVEYSISIQFVVFNYQFLANDQKRDHAYLQWCDFSFTSDGWNYYRLMRVETPDQKEREITTLLMRNKFRYADLWFLGCLIPADGSRWGEYSKFKKVKVKNVINQIDGTTHAYLTVKWFLGANYYMEVKRIRLHGLWHVKGAGFDEFKNEDYDDLSRSMLKSTVNQSEINPVKVTYKEDAIVITGSEKGENIKVYNTVGVEVQSTISKSDVVNIVLPKNQIYFVNIGQARYKVAM